MHEAIVVFEFPVIFPPQYLFDAAKFLTNDYPSLEFGPSRASTFDAPRLFLFCLARR